MLPDFKRWTGEFHCGRVPLQKLRLALVCISTGSLRGLYPSLAPAAASGAPGWGRSRNILGCADKQNSAIKQNMGTHFMWIRMNTSGGNNRWLRNCGFTSSLHSEFMCPVCLDMLKNTTQKTVYLSVFFADCIVTALRGGNKECSTCQKVGWALKNSFFWIVVLEKTFQSPLDCKKIKQINCKGIQSWIFIGRTDAEAEAPILWPTDAKNQIIRKDPDAGKDWRQGEKGTTEDEMVGWHH